MIPNNTATAHVENNIDAADTGQFTVDDNSLAKIMSVLTNLYSDPEGAVVREYLTNALDSQIEAQEKDPNYVWRPIEVTTPNRFNKNYIVRDFGTGMSTDDIRDIYSKYGKSTKEQSNSVTGMLGLGSKCALTYTGQFTITGYKNGVRTRAIISKNEENVPIFQIVDTRASDEPNGVEISVPVRDQNSFQDKTAKFLRFWTPGQVLVNGVEPEQHGFSLITSEKMEFLINKKATKAKVDIYLVDNGDYYSTSSSRSYVVMGNVPYSVNTDYISHDLNTLGLGFVAYVPMGSVSFPPNREELLYYPDTKATVKTISDGLLAKVLEVKKKEIEQAPTYREAWNAFKNLDWRYKETSYFKNLTYKGLKFVRTATLDHMSLTWDYSGSGQVNFGTNINLDTVISYDAIIVTGTDMKKKPTSYFKKKAKYYANEKGLKEDVFVFVDNDTTEPWLSELHRVSFSHINGLKLPKTPSNGGPRIDSPYDYVYLDSNGKPATSADVVIPNPNNKTIVYISPQAYKETYRKRGTNLGMIITQLGSDYILASMGTNRFEKFTRLNPGAVAMKDAIEDKVKNLMSSISAVEHQIGLLSQYEREFLASVKPEDIDDPELSALSKAIQASNGTSNFEKVKTLCTWAKRVEVEIEVPEAPKSVGVNPASKYPLIADIGSRRAEHLLVYVNAIWNQTQP